MRTGDNQSLVFTKYRTAIFAIAMAVLLSIVLVFVSTAATIGPDPVVPSSTTLQVSYVNTMPFVSSPTMPQNLGSPVTIKNKLYLIDQNDAIYRLNGTNIQKIFDVSQAPDGLALDNRQAILNISEGPRANLVYVMFTSGSEPTTDIPIYRMPAPLPGVCCIPGSPIPIADLYRIGPVPGPLGPFLGTTRTEFQVLYQYKLAGNKLKEPRAIAAFETQSGPTHNGGGMLTMPDGHVLFATGDALPFGADGRAAAQDPAEHVSKLLLIDPSDGSIEVAAVGVRNVQYIEYVSGTAGNDLAIAFGDIGGVTAEEVNIVAVADLLDTVTYENFGWGRNPDGIAREGTFYIDPGLPIVFGTEPPASAIAPSPEPGFIQPLAQFGRNSPIQFVAVTGPVTSIDSFETLTTVFSDLASGNVFGTSASLDTIDADVLGLQLIDDDGNALSSLADLAGGRPDPRFFRFPDGTAGVLLEATGDFYRLTEVSVD